MIKTGCGPYLNDWINRSVLTGVAMNGSAAIHDLELAIAGHTSEDVGPRLAAGTFRLRSRTAELFALACNRAADQGTGLGTALGEVILQHGGPGLEASVLVAGLKEGDPGDGTRRDRNGIVHMSPQLDGATLDRPPG